MLSKLFESLYLKVFISIVVFRAKSVVYVETVGKSGVIDTFEESFDTTGVDAKMYEYISTHLSESPFYYISILDKSLSQGACPSCSSKEMSQYFDVSSSKYICYAKSWSSYTSKLDIHSLEKEYSKIGLDFIFSPFVVLAKFFKDKIDTNMAMFILIEDSFITLSVFDNSELLYAQHLDMQHHEDSDELLMQENDVDDTDLEIDDIDLEDFDADELDNLGDIEDLDTVDDLDEFSDAKDIDEESEDKSDDLPIKEIDSFNEDYQRFLLIQGAISDFYKNEKYKSQFIESTYIADGVGVSGDLKRYLEEEMFLNVYVRSMDLNVEVCELAKAELQ